MKKSEIKEKLMDVSVFFKENDEPTISQIVKGISYSLDDEEMNTALLIHIKKFLVDFKIPKIAREVSLLKKELDQKN